MKKRKLFSVLLTLCMVVSMFLGISFSANAAEKEIKSATVASVPVAELGGSIADSKATLDVPEGCTADSHWHKWDANASDGYGDWIKVEDGTFNETDVYYLCITFKPAEGYKFSEDFEVLYADGVSEGNVYGESEGDVDYIEVYHCDMPQISFAKPIYKLEITLPEVKTGNIAEEAAFVFYSGDETIAPENFVIEENWTCATHDGKDVTGQDFEDGHAYEYRLNITPKAGYYFSENFEAYFNGEEDEFAFATTPTHYDFYYGHSLLPAMEKLELSGLPKEKAGETMVEDLTPITSLDDYSCEFFVAWWDENGEDTAGQKMEDGHVYTLQIEANLSGDVPVSENFIFVLDGIEYKATKVSTKTNQAWVEIEYDFSGGASAGDLEDPKTPEEPKVPDTPSTDKNTAGSNTTTAAKTGDSSSIMLWLSLAVISMGTIIFIRKKVN